MRRLSMELLGTTGTAHYVMQCECGGVTEFDFDGTEAEAFKQAEVLCNCSCFEKEDSGG